VRGEREGTGEVRWWSVLAFVFRLLLFTMNQGALKFARGRDCPRLAARLWVACGAVRIAIRVSLTVALS
jgi:hypothetical protein